MANETWNAQRRKLKEQIARVHHLPVDMLDGTDDYHNCESEQRMNNNIDPDDMVSHPRHYNTSPSGVECIDIVEHMSFPIGSAIKYLWRADEKGAPLEDLKKAKFYIDREIERRENAVGDRPARPWVDVMNHKIVRHAYWGSFHTALLEADGEVIIGHPEMERTMGAVENEICTILEQLSDRGWQNTATAGQLYMVITVQNRLIGWRPYETQPVTPNIVHSGHRAKVGGKRGPYVTHPDGCDVETCGVPEQAVKVLLESDTAQNNTSIWFNLYTDDAGRVKSLSTTDPIRAGGDD